MFAGNSQPLATAVSIMTTSRSPDQSYVPLWQRGRRWLVNALIVLLVAFMLIQGLPLKLSATSNRVHWLADWVGIGHEEWNMFAPMPDHQNHRVTAEVMSSFEHVAGRWSMPNWREFSTAERFRLHRWNEYYDHVWMNNNQVCWPALALHALRNAKYETSLTEDPPKQVKLMVETVTFPLPTGTRWPPPVPPEKFDDKWVLWIEQLHLNDAPGEGGNDP
jgi:hypothetical protein